jgi:hypothetical protein
MYIFYSHIVIIKNQFTIWLALYCRLGVMLLSRYTFLTQQIRLITFQSTLAFEGI